MKINFCRSDNKKREILSVCQVVGAAKSGGIIKFPYRPILAAADALYCAASAAAAETAVQTLSISKPCGA